MKTAILGTVVSVLTTLAVGQAMADGLELADRVAELDAFERVCARELEHAA